MGNRPDVRRGGLPDDRGRLAGGADRDAAGEALLRLRRRAARLLVPARAGPRRPADRRARRRPAQARARADRGGHEPAGVREGRLGDGHGTRAPGAHAGYCRSVRPRTVLRQGTQRRAAIIHHRSPPDLATRIVPRIGETERPDPVFGPEPDYVLSDEERDILSYVRSGPKGIAASTLDHRQLDGLGALVGAFARRLPDEVAGAQLHDIERAGMDNLVFAWAGSTEPGQRHYFRIQGPRLLIEHDNTQGNGNHIHSVWRNPADDFGDDVLAEHYRRHHQS